jgi:hypothetical protein
MPQKARVFSFKTNPFWQKYVAQVFTTNSLHKPALSTDQMKNTAAPVKAEKKLAPEW